MFAIVSFVKVRVNELDNMQLIKSARQKYIFCI